MKEKIKKCSKCGEEVMLNAKVCKHCNSDLRSWFAKHPLITAFVILIIVSMAVSSFDEPSPSTAPRSPNSGVNNQSREIALAKQKEIQDKISQIEITSSKIEDDMIGTPNLKVTFKNNSDKTIDALTVETYFLNNFDEPVGEWSLKRVEPFNGLLQEEIKPGGSYSAQWNLAVYDNASKIGSIRLVRVHFTDGEDLSVD